MDAFDDHDLARVERQALGLSGALFLGEVKGRDIDLLAACQLGQMVVQQRQIHAQRRLKVIHAVFLVPGHFILAAAKIIVVHRDGFHMDAVPAKRAAQAVCRRGLAA